MKRKWFGLGPARARRVPARRGCPRHDLGAGSGEEDPARRQHGRRTSTATVKKLDPATGELGENPVKVQSITKTDSEASDDDVAVWVQTSCVVIDIDDAPDCVDGDDPRLVDASTDVFATDRVTAEAVNDDEVPARRRGPARGPGQQVALRRGEEDLPLLGRHRRQGRRRGLRPDRGPRGHRDLRLQGRDRGRADRDRRGRRRHLRQRATRSGSSRRPARSSSRPRTSSATSRTAPRCST